MLPLFPDPIFAWVFAGALLAVTLAASCFDVRQWRIPNWLCVSALSAGLLLHAIRGYWLGGDEKSVWTLGAQGAWLGGLDGILFALAGFGVGFALFYVMWLIGSAGGGDVKLFAALGAWVGPTGVVFLLAATVIVVLALMLLNALLRPVLGEDGLPIFKRVPVSMLLTDAGRAEHDKKYARREKPRTRQVLAYSPALVLATALMLGWWFYKNQGEPIARSELDRAAEMVA